MQFPRSSGILMHLTSLPGHGIGDLGPDAFEFVRFLERAGQSLWQMLPIGPVGYGGSPYQSPSSFAGNALLISLETLVAEGWLTEAELRSQPELPEGRVDYERVIPTREALLRTAADRFLAHATEEARARCNAFHAKHAGWLDDFTLFVALKRHFGDVPWNEWERDVVHRKPETLQHYRSELATEINRELFIQWQFEEQWQKLRAFAHAHHVKLMGDLPVFVAFDSADVWANQHLFLLDDEGRPTVVAGVPPDYFSATGQLWGNPLYRWEAHAAENYRWWTSRLGRILELFDLVRIDHFRGFQAHWEIPAGAPDASHGHWVIGPGAALFRAAEAQLGPLPVVAEDLGLITVEVEMLRRELGFPGMRVLQFSFGQDPPGEDSRPHTFPQQCVVYTGTHDNDTTVGWFHGSPENTTRSAEDLAQERHRVRSYLHTDGQEIHWDLIRLAFENQADTAIVPLQDVLGLPSEARMNRPGTATGNWNWQLRRGMLNGAIESRLAQLTATTGRTTRQKAAPAA